MKAKILVTNTFRGFKNEIFRLVVLQYKNNSHNYIGYIINGIT